MSARDEHLATRRAALESALATGERHVLTASYQHAQNALAESLKQARGDNEEIELSLAEARLTHLDGVREKFLKQFDEGELRVLAEYWERVVPGASGLT